MRFACALLLTACPLIAQLPPAQAPTPALSSPRGANAHLVELETLALDSSGHLAPGLTAADFTLDSLRKVKVESCLWVDTREQRILVFLVDDLGLRAEQLAEVRGVIEKFVASRMKPGDRLAILRTGSGEGDLQQLTGDHAVLGEAIAHLRYNPRSVLYADGAARAGAFVSGSLGALRVAIEGVRTLTGRKSVVLFSPHLHEQPIKDLENLANAARRAEVSIYGIDPVAAVAQPESPRPPTPGATPVEFTNFALANLDTAAGMQGLAKRTAGAVYEAAGAVEQALTSALSGPDGYYRVAFQDPDFWDLSRLKVARTGYELWATRQVTESRSDLYAFNLPLQNNDDLPRAMSNPFFTGGIPVLLTPLFYYSAGKSALETLVHFEVRGLSFRRGVDGTYRGHVDVLVAAFGATAQSLQHASRSYDLVWKEEEYRTALRTGGAAKLTLAVPSGPMQIRAVVRDGTSGRLGSASQWLDAPAVQDGRLAVSGVVLEGAEEAAQEGPAAKDTGQTPEVRIFRAGEEIHYRCDLYNVSADSQKASRVELQMTFFGPDGKVITEPPFTIAYGPENEGPVRHAVGKMLFREGSSPGHYVVQMVYTDLLATGSVPRAAAQFAEFELRP